MCISLYVYITPCVYHSMCISLYVYITLSVYHSVCISLYVYITLCVYHSMCIAVTCLYNCHNDQSETTEHCVILHYTLAACLLVQNDLA